MYWDDVRAGYAPGAGEYLTFVNANDATNISMVSDGATLSVAIVETASIVKMEWQGPGG